MKIYIVFDGDYPDRMNIIKAFTSREKAIDFVIKEVHKKTDGMYSDEYVRKEMLAYTDYFDMYSDEFIGIKIIEVEE